MKLFSDCSGPCIACVVHNGICLAGHGDDDFMPVSKEWIKNHYGIDPDSI